MEAAGAFNRVNNLKHSERAIHLREKAEVRRLEYSEIEVLHQMAAAARNV